MTEQKNILGQPIGAAVPTWSQRMFPHGATLVGRYCRVEKFEVSRHAAELYRAFSESADGRDWTYLPAGPFADEAGYLEYMQKATVQADPLHHAIVVDGKPVGTAALMRVDVANGVVEIGHIAYSARLQRTRAGTEAMYLLMRHVFDDLGYRRYEWKCDSLNEPSRRAAVRYGFQYEGLFRQAVVYKGRTRDTAWFSIIDKDWPVVSAAFEKWLASENFDGAGRQVLGLAEIRKVVQARL